MTWYRVWILYHVNQMHVELTAVLGFNVILTGSFFPEPYRCHEAEGFVFCILLCNTDSTALYNVCGCVDDCK